MRTPILPTFLALAFCTATAGAQIVVEATISGPDGRPLPMAHAHLKHDASQRDALAMAEADRNGVARVEVPAPGLYYLSLTGVSHRSSGVPLFVVDQGNIPVTARLAPHGFAERPDTVLIIGDFNDFAFDSAQPMTPNGDGTFSAEFPSTTTTFRYQVISATRSPQGEQLISVNGTQSDGYEYDGGGDYLSVVATSGGVARVTFDPARVVRTLGEASVSFPDSLGAPSDYLQSVARKEARERAMYAAYKEAMKDGNAPEFSWEPTEQARRLEAFIRSEPAGTRRSMAMVEYLSLDLAESDTAIAREALGSIPPTSTLWTMSPSAVAAASRAAEDSQFVERVLATHASGVLRSELLFMLLQRAHYFSEDTAAERRYYSRLVGEFPDSRFANMAKSRFNPDRTIRKGGVAPDFSVAALDDSTIVYTKQSFAGRYLLLDFWATWCGPCIGELGKLTEAVEKYRGDRLEVLSLSFDATPGKVREFRAGKWKMPWLHTFVARGFANQLARSFEVSGIPRPILIDPEGRIVALETELRGSRLAKTLAKFLGDTAQR